MAGFARGALGGATSGISQLLGSLMLGDRAQQQGYDTETTAQTKMAQALAQVQQAQAAARLHDAQAGEVTAASARAAGRPAMVDAALAASAGTDVPTLNTYRQKLTTGQAPQVPMGPPAENGSMGLGSEQIPAEVSSRLGQALSRFLPAAMAEKDVNPEQWAKAQGLFQDQDQESAVQRGAMTPMSLAQLRYAAKGSAPYHFDSTGAVGNQLTGALDTGNPMAQGTIKLKGEQAGAQKANAAQSYAAAGASNAHAALFGAQTTQVNGAPKGVLVQTDAGPVFSDPRTGQSVPVVGADGQPMGAKLKQIPPAINTAIITNAQNISKVEQALSLLEGKKVGDLQGDNEATGWKGYLPNSVLNRVDPSGVDTRAMISDIGSLVLHDRSGAAVTASETPRLMPFIPLATDDPVAVKRKLTRFLQVYKQEQDALGSTYSKDQGYQPSPVKPAVVPTGPAAPAPAAPSASSSFTNAEKERRYQVWKAQQKGPQ